MIDSPIHLDIDAAADGVQHGFMRLPHSDDRSAWGAILVPVTVIRNGSGPTVLLTGANHGDEYEGPVALLDLARTLDPGEVRGRLVIVPMMNYPAFCAGRRTSPIDGGNLNRVFPGRPDGTVTEKIADYFERCLLPEADFVLDIHSGGRTLEFVPFAAAHVLDDKDQQRRCEAAMRAFAAPYSVLLRELDDRGMYDTAAEAQGKVFVSTELGGGGTTTRATNAIARRGVRNFCIHAGVLARTPEAAPSQDVDMPDGDCFVTALDAGLLEPRVDLGEPVSPGQVLARVHPTGRTGLAPAEYRAKRAGILLGRHFPGLVQPGDNLAVIGVPVS